MFRQRISFNSRNFLVVHQQTRGVAFAGRSGGSLINGHSVKDGAKNNMNPEDASVPTHMVPDPFARLPFGDRTGMTAFRQESWKQIHLDNSPNKAMKDHHERDYWIKQVPTPAQDRSWHVIVPGLTNFYRGHAGTVGKNLQYGTSFELKWAKTNTNPLTHNLHETFANASRDLKATPKSAEEVVEGNITALRRLFKHELHTKLGYLLETVGNASAVHILDLLDACTVVGMDLPAPFTAEDSAALKNRIGSLQTGSDHWSSASEETSAAVVAQEEKMQLAKEYAWEGQEIAMQGYYSLAFRQLVSCALDRLSLLMQEQRQQQQQQPNGGGGAPSSGGKNKTSSVRSRRLQAKEDKVTDRLEALLQANPSLGAYVAQQGGEAQIMRDEVSDAVREPLRELCMVMAQRSAIVSSEAPKKLKAMSCE